MHKFSTVVGDLEGKEYTTESDVVNVKRHNLASYIVTIATLETINM
jgi:hypothetical protein